MLTLHRQRAQIKSIAVSYLSSAAPPGLIVPDFQIAPGYSSTGFFEFENMTSTLPATQANVAFSGTGGRIVAVW